eukprot:2345590-Amphidinium_carterae.3
MCLLGQWIWTRAQRRTPLGRRRICHCKPPEPAAQELAEQLYTVLMSLTDSDLVMGARAGEGLETWRRLHRRWDPGENARTGEV